MLDPLEASLRIAGSGLESQSTRLRVVAENLANAQSTGETPGADPYQRKTVTFASEIDRASGVAVTKVRTIGTDPTPFRIERDPGNPAADAQGNVKMPNVDALVEIADMREANRSYQANLQVVKQARDLVSMTLDLLKA
jgi:flagellar basal-body rod protein FlgC